MKLLQKISKNLQIRTVPKTAEIFPWICTKPALPAFCNSVLPTDSNVPTKWIYFNAYNLTDKMKL
jgi:hypothetical protein